MTLPRRESDLNFTSTIFVIFLIVMLFAFYISPEKYRKSVLLIGSYIFYASWSLPFISVILITTSVDYWLAKFIQRNQTRCKLQQRALIFGIAVNVFILTLFKYSNFLLDTTHGIFHWLGYNLSLPHQLNIILPLGISFYTFEAISYLVDTYRGKPPAQSWLDYNFYIMYFPHLISGPIIRFCELYPQYQHTIKNPTINRIAHGFELIFLGFFFKIFIADVVAQFVDPIFANPSTANTSAVYIAAIAFTVQIYFDFMGYTHIARGTSLLFNIELPLNFNHPYLASNISNFWERWHISLSKWIRDYLYFPLGGSHNKLPRTITNLLAVMLIAGAWHGAGWTYILWGGFHGILLGFYHLYKTTIKVSFDKLNVAPYIETLRKFFSISLTFSFVVIGWILFRAPNLATFGIILHKLVHLKSLFRELYHDAHMGQFGNICTLFSLISLCFMGPLFIEKISKLYRSLPYFFKVQASSILAILVWIFLSGGITPFIYFQF